LFTSPPLDLEDEAKKHTRLRRGYHERKLLINTKTGEGPDPVVEAAGPIPAQRNKVMIHP